MSRAFRAFDAIDREREQRIAAENVKLRDGLERLIVENQKVIAECLRILAATRPKCPPAAVLADATVADFTAPGPTHLWR